MKRKNASLFGNVLMGLGLVVMVVGVGYSILNQLPQFNLPQFFAHGAINHLPQFNLPQFFAHGAILSIFVGAVLWLAGARVGGHEQVSDKYWWVRHYDKRCRRSDNRRHS
ncbi:stress-induced protein YchH [Salmonella enterica]|nr:stress-induced protein YchH [Salmonella enterica]